MGSPLPSFRMRREQRLRHRKDFDAVFREGRPVNTTVLAVRAVRNHLDTSRFGFSVSKRVGKAVVRNLVKRRLREAVRALAPPIGWDVVVIARAPAATVPYDELVTALRSALRRARVMDDREPRPPPAPCTEA